MKSKTRAQIGNAMRRAGNTTDRQEQKNLEKILSFIFDKYLKVPYSKTLTEILVTDLREVSGIKPYVRMPPKLDVVLNLTTTAGYPRKIGFRLMGPPHEEKIRRIRDENQKILLEGNDWVIYDFWYDRHFNIWNAHKSIDDFFFGTLDVYVEMREYILQHSLK